MSPTLMMSITPGPVTALMQTFLPALHSSHSPLSLRAVMRPGESLCCFFVKSISSGAVVPMMQTIIMDLYNAQLPKDKDWFRKTREDRFGAPLEKVSNFYLQDQHFLLPEGLCCQCSDL